MTLSTPGQYRALAHPLRHRLLFALGQEPATLSGLAAELGISKGSAGHHLKILVEAGLVRLAHTSRVRGGTEQYYARAARKYKYDTSGEGTRAALGAVADELLTDPGDPLMVLRNVRLTEERARRLRATLEELVDGLADDGEGERHGVLVGLYRPAPPA
nr:hypothetical protein GCM10025732_39330 [Glycomyces mayteni]